MSGTYDVTLAPNASAPINAVGGYCKVITAPGGQVQLKTDNGDTWTVYEGQGFRMPDGVEFTRVFVKNLAAIAQTIFIVIGDSRFEDTRITGNVRVIDQAADKTRGGNQMFGSISSPANAGLVSVCGIVPKTVKVDVKALMVSSATAGIIAFYKGTGQGTANPDYANPMRNKLVLGGADATSRVTTGNTAVQQPAVGEMPGAVLWFTTFVAANSPVVVPLTTPIELSGATSFLVSGCVVNRDVLIVIDAEES